MKEKKKTIQQLLKIKGWNIYIILRTFLATT